MHVMKRPFNILKIQAKNVIMKNIDIVTNKDNNNICGGMLKIFHQTVHLTEGFIALFIGQSKSVANCAILEKGPRTRKRDGECCPVKISSDKLSGRDFSHQIFAAAIQNSCRTL